MGLLYSRTENNEEIVIVYTYKAYIYFFLFFAFAVSFTNIAETWGVASALLFLLLLIFGFWKPNREIKKAMESKKVEMSGKNFSAANPLTFKIKK